MTLATVAQEVTYNAACPCHGIECVWTAQRISIGNSDTATYVVDCPLPERTDLDVTAD